MEHRMSRFWATGGILTLPEWGRKGVKQAERVADEPLPTPAELEAFAQMPLDARQAVEQAGYGFVLSIADSQDKKRERTQQKRAA